MKGKEYKEQMPDIHDQRGDLFRVESTIYATTEANKRLADLYPQVTPETPLVLDAYERREIAHVSVALNESPQLLRRVVTDALTYATSPEDTAFCRHGAEDHAVFDEAVERVKDSVGDGTANFSVQSHKVEARTEIGPQSIEVQRVVIESEAKNRSAFIPRASSLGEAVAKESDIKMKARRLRALAEDEGVAQAMLTATYSGLSIDETFDIFAEPNFQRKMKEARVRIPTRNRQGDASVLKNLRDSLVVVTSAGVFPKYSLEAFSNGLSTLEQGRYITPEEARTLFVPDRVDKIARGRAVFSGLSEAAQRGIGPKLHSVARVNYLSERSNIITTNLVTGYLLVEPN